MPGDAQQFVVHNSQIIHVVYAHCHRHLLQSCTALLIIACTRSVAGQLRGPNGQGRLVPSCQTQFVIQLPSAFGPAQAPTTALCCTCWQGCARAAGRVRGLKGHRWLVLSCETKLVMHDLVTHATREASRTVLDGKAPTVLAFLYNISPLLLGRLLATVHSMDVLHDPCAPGHRLCWQLQPLAGR